jgi:hypothetical protein
MGVGAMRRVKLITTVGTRSPTSSGPLIKLESSENRPTVTRMPKLTIAGTRRATMTKSSFTALLGASRERPIDVSDTSKGIIHIY